MQFQSCFNHNGKENADFLEKMFKAMKTIPPTSIEAERVFSTAGIFITKLRNRLIPSSSTT
jgi:hypothetical protein